MSAAVLLRPDLDTTLGDLIQDKGVSNQSNTSTDLSLDRISLHPAAETPFIALGETEVPLTSTGLNTLADILQVPAPFFKRLAQHGHRQSDLLTLLLNDTGGEVVRAEYNDAGLMGLSDPEVERVRPGQMLRVAEKIMASLDAPIQRLIDTPAEFSFDVHVPFDAGRGVGGDASSEVEVSDELARYSWMSKAPVTKKSKVGDLSAAGLRFGLDMKRGLAPSVQPWTCRLVCTNGMESRTEATKIDARGLSVEEVLADLEAKAEIAFSRAEREMVHLYELRNQRVENPERRLRAMAREHGVPDRSLVRMLDVAPEALGDSPTEFDLINMWTNLANHSSMRNDGGRRLLESTAGQIVSDLGVRCGRCHNRLDH